MQSADSASVSNLYLIIFLRNSFIIEILNLSALIRLVIANYI
jgi:hypothetical protein